MKTLDSDNARLGRELADLQGRLTQGERAEKESRREVLGLRQKLLKGESSLEALKQEVTAVGGLLCACVFPPEDGAEPATSGTLPQLY